MDKTIETSRGLRYNKSTGNYEQCFRYREPGSSWLQWEPIISTYHPDPGSYVKFDIGPEQRAVYD